MKKITLALNLLLILLCFFLMLLYDARGGLCLKGATAAAFVLLGTVNALYALHAVPSQRRFALLMAAGLWVCMAGDLVLNLSFIPGAAIFALGHALYCLAFGAMTPYKKGDLLPMAAVFLLSLLLLLLLPALHFSSALMAGVVVVYALIISCTVGKAIANFLGNRRKATGLLLLGALLFFFSDLMLLLFYFAGAPQITDTLCLYTYFPGQCLLAHAIFHARPAPAA